MSKLRMGVLVDVETKTHPIKGVLVDVETENHRDWAKDVETETFSRVLLLSGPSPLLFRCGETWINMECASHAKLRAGGAITLNILLIPACTSDAGP